MNLNHIKKTHGSLLTDESRLQSVNYLNQVLADEFTLFTKILNYHWNVTGPGFISLHTLLESQYKEMIETMDNVAERVRILGEAPISTMKGMTSKSDIVEMNGITMSENEILNDLLNSNVGVQEKIRDYYIKNAKSLEIDPITETLLLELLSMHEQRSWVYRSHLQ